MNKVKTRLCLAWLWQKTDIISEDTSGVNLFQDLQAKMNEEGHINGVGSVETPLSCDSSCQSSSLPESTRSQCKLTNAVMTEPSWVETETDLVYFIHETFTTQSRQWLIFFLIEELERNLIWLVICKKCKYNLIDNSYYLFTSLKTMLNLQTHSIIPLTNFTCQLRASSVSSLSLYTVKTAALWSQAAVLQGWKFNIFRCIVILPVISDIPIINRAWNLFFSPSNFSSLFTCKML